METEPVSNGAQKTNAEKLCLAAIISFFIGIGLLFLSLALNWFAKKHWRGSGDAFACGAWASFGLIVFVTPFLGFFAILNMLSCWRDTTRPALGRPDEGHVRRIAGRFLVCSILFAIVCLLPTVFFKAIVNANLPCLVDVWFFVMSLLAFGMSIISFRLFACISARFRLCCAAIFSVIVSFGAVALVFLSTCFGNYLVQRLGYLGITQTFSGKSDLLVDTVIVPTLDIPHPENKNVIWCSSFQLAWNKMKDDVIGEPVKVVGAEELAACLNTARQTEADLEADSFYAAAGRVKEGIIDKIRKGMAAKFPSHSVPDFNEVAAYPNGILSYSYLTANVPFKYPFRHVKREFTFTDSNGVETNVGAFGVWGVDSCYKRMREQVEVLYVQEDWDADDPDLRMKEFVIDLCKHSKPYQVVAAVVEPEGSLAQTLDYVRAKIADSRLQKRYKHMSVLDSVDALMVPEMFWEIDHPFDELIGKIVANANPAMPIVEARQAIKFRLDRYGAMLESEAMIFAAAMPRDFIFNRPFLVYMKRRDSERPFFVMWVDNAELLNK